MPETNNTIDFTPAHGKIIRATMEYYFLNRKRPLYNDLSVMTGIRMSKVEQIYRELEKNGILTTTEARKFGVSLNGEFHSPAELRGTERLVYEKYLQLRRQYKEEGRKELPPDGVIAGSLERPVDEVREVLKTLQRYGFITRMGRTQPPSPFH